MITIKKLFLTFCLICLALSFCACTPQNNNNEKNHQDTNVVKRDYNYLTGKDLAENESLTQRPVAVMIDNHKLSLPQSGIENADIIYEMVTEGGITRLMAVYSNLEKINIAGPVRSARDQFVQFVLPLNAIYVHIGTSVYASDMLNFYNYQDIDGLYLGVTSFDFDKQLATTKPHEHCWFTKSNLILDGINTTNLNPNGNLYPAFNFARSEEEKNTLENGKPAIEVAFRFSNYADAGFIYNTDERKYYKSSFGVPQIDKEAGIQVSFDNVFLLSTKVDLYPDGLCTSFDLSKGKGYYFYGGKYIPIKWEKGSPENPLKITNNKGELIKVNQGKSYVAIIDEAMLDTLKISDTLSSQQDVLSVDSQP